MATVAELKALSAKFYGDGAYVSSLRIADALITADCCDYEARLKVADCLAALAEPGRAAQVYAAVAEFAIRAGHPLISLVCARAIAGLPVPDAAAGAKVIDEAMVSFYGRDSSHLGKMAARVRLPDGGTKAVMPDLNQLVDDGFVAQAAERAVTATASFDEYPTALHPIALLSTLSPTALRRVLQTVIVKRLPAGAHLIREGEPGESFFFIAGGALRVYDIDGLGRQIDLARLHENAIVGEMALLSAEPRSASVEVVAEADVIELTRASLAALADELPAIAQALHEFTRERLLGNLMATSPLFRPFDRVRQRELLRQFSTHDVAPGTDIIRAGEPGRGLFVMLSGEAEVLTRDESGEEVSVATLRGREIFGEMALLSGTPTEATVRAIRPTTVLFLDREHVERIALRVPEIRRYLEGLATERRAEVAALLAPVEDEDGSVNILI